MLDKMRRLAVLTHAKITGFARDFKEDERGLDGPVAAVLLVLVAVLAVAFLWSVLSGQLEKWWKQIIGAADSISSAGGGGGDI